MLLTTRSDSPLRPLPPCRRDNRDNSGLRDLHETVSEAAVIIQRCYLPAQMNSERTDVQEGITAHGSESSLGLVSTSCGLRLKDHRKGIPQVRFLMRLLTP